MPRFLRENDINLFKIISTLLVHLVIDTPIIYYKLNTRNTKANIYGLTDMLVFDNPIEVPCVILHTPPDVDYQYIRDYTNTNIYRFLKTTMDVLNLIPLIGDYIYWINKYWLIVQIFQLQIIGGRQLNVWTYACTGTVVSDSKLKQLTTIRSKTRKVKLADIYD